jgi:hypothetical protein
MITLNLTKFSQASCFFAVQGNFEAHSEAYDVYDERALEKLTQQCKKSSTGASDFVGRQGAAAWSL